VLVALLLIPILGVLAIVLDGGQLRDSRRKAQGAADAAALAAGTKLFVNYPAIDPHNPATFDPGGAGAAAALASSATNGYPNDGTRSNVAVHIPPQTGPFTGKAGYAEVVVTYNQPRAFSAIWAGSTIPVIARAVSRGRWGGTHQGILVLDPGLKSSLNASGTGAATVTGGAAVIVNSNNTTAASATGGGGITASEFEITGGYTGALNGPVTTDVPPTPDPLRYLPEPPVPADGTMTITHLGSGNRRYTLSPGRFTNLPGFNVGDEVVLRQASVNSAQGIFFIDGDGFKSTGANITMDPSTTGGVMIYNNPAGTSLSGAIQITGNSAGTVNLSALTTGPYAGMLFWQKRSATQQMSIAGGGNFSLTGTFYAANAELKITGNGDATIGSQYISRSLTMGGNGNIRIDYTDNGTARLREAILVE
jgi:hypothetical protein